jgi:hypothetical protein
VTRDSLIGLVCGRQARGRGRAALRPRAGRASEELRWGAAFAEHA